MLNKKEKKEPEKIPHSTIDSIPYDAAYQNGIIKVKSGYYSKSYLFPEVNFYAANEKPQWDIAEGYANFISSFDATTTVFMTLYNRSINKEEAISKITIALKDDGLDEYRREYNDMVTNKLSNTNNLFLQPILTITVQAIDIFEADQKFSNQIDKNVADYLSLISDKSVSPMSIAERLDVLNSIYNKETYIPLTQKTEINGKVIETFSLQECANQGISSKEALAPDFMDITNKRILINEHTYAKGYYIQTYPSYLKGNVITDLCNLPTNTLVTTVYSVMDTLEGIKEIKAKSGNVRGELIERQKKASHKGYSVDLLSPDLNDAKEESELMLEKVTKDDDKAIKITVLITIFADSEDELRAYETQLKLITNKHQLSLRVANRRHEMVLNTCLPIGNMQIDNKRLVTTETVYSLSPYSVKNLSSDKGIYYGVHGIGGNLILYNRMDSLNPNCAILGVPGSGKSFIAKEEIINILLSTDDDIYIIDPEGEMTEIAKALGGSVIKISKGSDYHINPFDMTLDNADDDAPDPIKTKCDFITTIMDIMIGGRYGLSPIERSILDRCTNEIYDPYVKYLNSNNISQDYEKAPTLIDLYNCLKAQPQPEAMNMALSLERYVKGGVDTFAYTTNLDITNRFTVYNIKDIGASLKELGLQICLDNVWNKMIENFKKGKRTWFYIDEFYLMMQKPTSAAYVAEIWKRARKWNGLPCAITQNVEDLLKSEDARTVINNCATVIMMGQAPMNKQQLVKMYGLSPTEQKYIESPKPGTGLIIINNKIIVPMINEFPKNTKLYKIMTTKPDERIS